MRLIVLLILLQSLALTGQNAQATRYTYAQFNILGTEVLAWDNDTGRPVRWSEQYFGVRSEAPLCSYRQVVAKLSEQDCEGAANCLRRLSNAALEVCGAIRFMPEVQSLPSYPLPMARVEVRTCSGCDVVVSKITLGASMLATHRTAKADEAGCATFDLPKGSTVTVETNQRSERHLIPLAVAHTIMMRGDASKMTPFQQLEYRNRIEENFQMVYGKQWPGCKVDVFMRGNDFLLMVTKGKAAPIVFLVDATDENHPVQKMSGVIIKKTKRTNWNHKSKRESRL